MAAWQTRNSRVAYRRASGHHHTLAWRTKRLTRREAGTQSLRASLKRKGRMVSEEMQDKVDAAVEKYLRGEELTNYEQTLLAYTWFAAGCSSCGGTH